jgi:hypothetical protein
MLNGFLLNFSPVEMVEEDMLKGKTDKYTALKVLLIGYVLLLTLSCSHKYNSNELDLSYYQWNMWAGDEGAGQGISSDPAPPGCGWDEFNRGVGNLVRIPATFESQFSVEENKGVLWYHCRFTLPDLWHSKTIHLAFENAGPGLDLFLNEQFVESHKGNDTPFELNITDQVYYTRDNHLAIKVIDSESGSNSGAFGIMGKIVVKSSAPPNDSAH